ncbi:V-set and immunoglobulin domain-containing protein 2 [Xenopus tropicalis]|uniref:V-set and immunoglobulin domain-containing protein 2 n=1 Tax=Xenopus tropicalis TaxID=8364 RepID=UPI0012F695AA|nr:V-set and immunoglobulin domain-containing protein 2 [Xenopus tropicalis]
MFQRYLLVFSIGLIFFKDAVITVDVTIPENTVVGKTGSNVILPCIYSSTPGSQFVLEWKFAPGKTAPSDGRQIYYYSNGQTYKPGSQSERLSISATPPVTGIASIHLNNIISSDSGSYVCEVNNPPDFSGTGSGIVKLIVQVPPSTPTCQLNGKAIAGSDVTLMCSSAEGYPTPVYSWTFAGSKVSSFPSMLENEISGSLLITNISQANSGTYQCLATNDQGTATCDLTVSVTTAADAGTIAGVVVGVLLAILLIVAVAIYILCYRRKQKKAPKPDYPGNEIREDAMSPGMREGRRSSQTDSYLLNNAATRHESMVV